MSFTVKIVLILFGLAYLISPVDLIPDLLLPWVGWIDDGVILWSIYYLIRYGELPWFLFRKKAVKGFPAGPGGTNQNRDQGPGDQSGTAGRDAGENRKTEDRAAGNKTGKSRTTSPYEILGVRDTASWNEIQAAYKEKIKQYHPDKLSHLGDEFADLANEKFLEIQAAYGKLKKRHRT